MSEILDEERLIEQILRAGTKSAADVEVFLSEGHSVNAELKRDLIGEAGESRSWGLGIRVISEGRIGASSTNDPARWKDCLQAALDAGKLATPQEWGGLPEKADVSRKLATFDPSLEVDVHVAHDLLREMLVGAEEHPADIVGGSAGLSTGSLTLANSNGVMYSREGTGVGISLETISGTSTGYEFGSSCFMDLDPVDVGRKAAFYAVHSVGGKEIADGTYDLVLSPVAVAELLGNVFVPALSGRNVGAGRSFLADRIGEECMPPGVSLYDDPFHGQRSTNWDSEGVLTRRLDFVQDGILKCFAYDLRTAYRYGTKSTGSAVRGGPGGAPSIGMHNLYLDGPRSETGEEPALYAHDLVGAHTANPVTGDFSVELSNASWIEGGNPGEPVRSAMLSGNVFSMLREISALGPESRSLGSMVLPSVRFNSQQIIGK